MYSVSASHYLFISLKENSQEWQMKYLLENNFNHKRPYTVKKIGGLVRHSERGRRPIYKGDGKLLNTSA